MPRVRSPWPDVGVTQLVHDGIGVEARGFVVTKVDERVTDHVHALRERTRGTHGVEPCLETQHAAGAGDFGLGVEKHLERLDVPSIGRTGVPLQKPPELFVGIHRTATGLTGHPVPRAIRSGPIAKRNSQRSAIAHCSANRASATLSMRWSPIAVIPI